MNFLGARDVSPRKARRCGGWSDHIAAAGTSHYQFPAQLGRRRGAPSRFEAHITGVRGPPLRRLTRQSSRACKVTRIRGVLGNGVARGGQLLSGVFVGAPRLLGSPVTRIVENGIDKMVGRGDAHDAGCDALRRLATGTAAS